MKREIVALFAVCLLCALTGCAHELDIRNLRTYQDHPVTTVEKPVVVGVVAPDGDVDVKRLTNGVVKGLQRASAKPIYPFNPSGTKQASAIAHLSITPERHGSAWNFPINWPGFLIFTPAWNGYVYHVNYDVNVLLCNQENLKIDELKIPIRLSIRHADINRTWTEIGWFEIGIIPLIGACVFPTYDTDVTPEVAGKIEAPIGDYIAQEIVKSVNAHIDQVGSVITVAAPSAPAATPPPAVTPPTASGFQGTFNSGTEHLGPKRSTGQTAPSW